MKRIRSRKDAGTASTWTDRILRSIIVRMRVILRGERALYFLLFVLTGVIGGLVASGVRWLGVGLQTIFFGSSGSMLSIALSLPWYWRLAAPAAGALLAALVIHYAVRGSEGSGVSEIMEAVALRQRSLGLGRALLKSFSSLLLMNSGGSVGREGPTAAVSAAVSTRIAHALQLTPARRNILIGCGVAAGMGAVYNAPLGAALFVMEVVIANFAMDVFGPLVVSSVTATLVSRALLGAGPLYSVPSFSLGGFPEYLALGLLGIPCAFMGNFFRIFLQRSTDLMKKIRLHPVPKLVAGGLLVGAMGVYLPQVWGNGYDAVSGVLNERFALQVVALICIGKILATTLSLGSGGLGGIMTPTLLIGATFGGLTGHLLQDAGAGVVTQPGAWALVGMAGVLAATTHAPIMATFLTFELCQEYTMILPLGVCAGASALMARRLKGTSIYAERLARRGVDLDASIEESALHAIRVMDVVWRDPPTVPPGLPVRAVVDRFLKSRRHLLHVVGEDGTYFGLIAIQDILPAADDRNLDQLVVAVDVARPMPSVSLRDPVSSIMERFWFQEYGELPVLTGGDPPKFIGIVTRRDTLGAFDREVLRARVLTARYRLQTREEVAPLPLVGDFSVKEIPIPESLHGKTLADLALPKTLHLTVLAFKRAEEGRLEEVIPPPLDIPFRAGDRLVLMGRKSHLADFSRL
jgi:CIC family chloride channel protein